MPMVKPSVKETREKIPEKLLVGYEPTTSRTLVKSLRHQSLLSASYPPTFPLDAILEASDVDGGVVEEEYQAGDLPGV